MFKNGILINLGHPPDAPLIIVTTVQAMWLSPLTHTIHGVTAHVKSKIKVSEQWVAQFQMNLLRLNIFLSLCWTKFTSWFFSLVTYPDDGIMWICDRIMSPVLTLSLKSLALSPQRGSLSSSFWRYIYFILFICIVHNARVSSTCGCQKGYWITCNWSYRWMWATTWMLGVEPRSSAKAWTVLLTEPTLQSSMPFLWTMVVITKMPSRL